MKLLEMPHSHPGVFNGRTNSLRNHFHLGLFLQRRKRRRNEYAIRKTRRGRMMVTEHMFKMYNNKRMRGWVWIIILQSIGFYV
jgi:uridine kinase